MVDETAEHHLKRGAYITMFRTGTLLVEERQSRL